MSKLSPDFPGADALIAEGFTTLHKVESATDDELLAVPGIGPATLEKIRAAIAGESDAVAEETAPQVSTSSPEPFSCASLACGHSITAYPCPYCGFSQ